MFVVVQYKCLTLFIVIIKPKPQTCSCRNAIRDHDMLKHKHHQDPRTRDHVPTQAAALFTIHTL
jgi:hypothetical protein